MIYQRCTPVHAFPENAVSTRNISENSPGTEAGVHRWLFSISLSFRAAMHDTGTGEQTTGIRNLSFGPGSFAILFNSWFFSPDPLVSLISRLDLTQKIAFLSVSTRNGATMVPS
jgi:hypothetical protein